ncbi:AAA family ATPase [Desulfolithobacter sp.]
MQFNENSTSCQHGNADVRALLDKIEKQKAADMPEVLQGSSASGKQRPEVRGTDKKAAKASVSSLIDRFGVKEEFVKNLGLENFLYPDLIIAGHIVVLIAMPGGGKTTFLYREVCPHMAQQGHRVLYIDADSPVADYHWMFRYAEKHGFILINPDINEGTSVNNLLDSLQEMADSQADMSDTVLIFDTLKKFSDLMSKSDTKEFFRLCRSLTYCGATIVLLAHSNKYRSPEGHLIPEGVNDVRADADELIFLERKTRDDGGIDVTTVVDPDKGAKLRGIFKPFSFRITPERKIEFYPEPLKLEDHSATRAPRATDDEILTEAENYLREAGPIKKTALAQHLNDVMEGAGLVRIKRVLSANSEVKRDGVAPRKRLVYTVVSHGAQLFELPDKHTSQPAEQKELFGA